MARPNKQPHERREERFNLRFTIAERLHIEEQAERAGLHPTEYLRQRCLDYEVSPAPARAGVDPSLLSALSRIGNNVNQIALAKNTDRHYSGDWKGVQSTLQTLLTELASRHVR
jgi:hypothetical protein